MNHGPFGKWLFIPNGRWFHGPVTADRRLGLLPQLHLLSYYTALFWGLSTSS
jgi:hypothetical protein